MATKKVSPTQSGGSQRSCGTISAVSLTHSGLTEKRFP